MDGTAVANAGRSGRTGEEDSWATGSEMARDVVGGTIGGFAFGAELGIEVEEETQGGETCCSTHQAQRWCWSNFPPKSH